MQKRLNLLLFSFLLISNLAISQDKQVIENIVNEARENSQLENLAHELLDVVGPRLVGTPQMMNAHNWAVKKFESWGIPAENQQWGEWRGWERGIIHD